MSPRRRVRGPGLHGVVGRVPSRGATSNVVYSVRLLALALGVQTGWSEVVTYPGPAGRPPSEHYAVEVTQAGRTQASFVYCVNAQWRSNPHRDTSWTTFSFAGRVQVKVARLAGPFSSCRILPSSFGIEPRRGGNAVVFELDRPRKLAVEFDRETTHPLLVFADPLEADVPKPGQQGVTYFGPGVHDLGEGLEVRSGQTVYLAGGAYVYGRILGRNASDVGLLGRGVLSGEKLAEKTPAGQKAEHFIMLRGRSDRVLVEGLTLVNSPRFNLTLAGGDSVVRNVKMISWWFSTDGVDAGLRGLVEDCFFKVNDDAVKLYQSGTRVRRCVFWQMENGAPFQISWNMDGEHRSFQVSDCDILRVEHKWNNDNEAVFSSIHGGNGHMRDYLFENIRIENAGWRLANLLIKTNIFARARERGHISNLTFRNITVSGPLQRPSGIKGWDADHRISDVTFEDLRINDRMIRSAEEGNFQIDPGTTRNIRFVVTEPAARQNNPASETRPK